MKIFVLIFFSIILLSCFSRTIENKIVDHIKANCKHLQCTVRIRDVTDFDWDKMYVFDTGFDGDEIKTVIGTYVPEKTALTRKLVFTKGGKVVHYDELPTNIEGMVNNEVLFDDAGNYSHKIYSIEDAVFEAQKNSHNGKEVYFNLKQIKSASVKQLLRK